MYCQNCGSKNSGRGTFCGICGVKLTNQISQPVAPLSPPIISRSPDNNYLPDFFRNNAYHILGIDTTISSKDIQKRAREILTRLKIDDIPLYNLDFEPAGNFRTEGRVKIAIQNLSSPKQCLKEFFFWFDLEDLIDQNITKFLKEQQIQQSITLWQQAIDAADTNDKRFSNQKNLSISYSILLASGRFKYYLSPSLTAWNYLISSDDFWIYFFKRYRQKTEFDLNAETMNEFKTRLPELLSDLYAEIGQITQDPDYFKEFQRKFSVKGEKIEKDVLSPIYSEIYSLLDELKSINFDKEAGLNSDKIQKCKIIISKISGNLNQLERLGIYEISEIKTLRDKVAESIKNVSVAIYNNLNDIDEAMGFVTTAYQICGTDIYRKTLKIEINQLEEIKKNNELLQPIIQSIEKEQFEAALGLISKIDQFNIPKSLSESLKNLKKTSITRIIIEKYNLAQKFMKNNNYYEAKPLFENAGKLIHHNLALYNFNEKVINDIISDLHSRIQYSLSRRNLNELNNFRNELLAVAKKHFVGQYEEDILIILIDSTVYPVLINSGVYSGRSQSSSSCCFVITATMGDRTHPFVIFLQQFRDDYLLKRRWGQLFNHIYKWIGPYCAGIIRNRKFLQSLSLILIVKPGVFFAKKILGLEPKV